VRNETKTSTIFFPLFIFVSTADNKGSSSNGVVAQPAATSAGAAVEADESHPSGRDGSSWTTATVQSTASATAASSSSSSQQTIDSSSSSSSSSSSVCSQQEYEILKVKASAVPSIRRWHH